MIAAIREMFSEDNDRLSATRLMCFICLVNATALSWFHPDAINVGMWLGTAFGAKLIQKPMEETVKCEPNK